MYPNFRYLFYGLFGVDIPFLQAVQTFGFFLAMAFLVSGWILMKELRRREKLGLLSGYTEETIIGGAPNYKDLIIGGLVGFVIGFKVLFFIFNQQEAHNLGMPDIILSGKGNLIGGLLGLLIGAGFKFWDKNRKKLEQPKIISTEVMPHQRVGDIVILAAVSGILGAKLLFLVEDWEYFSKDPIGALLSPAGLTFYGGLIGGATVTAFYLRSKKVNLVQMLDAVAPSLILAYGIGRQGCQWSGDGDWGIAAGTKPGWLNWLPNWLWAQNYPNNVSNEGNDIVANSMIMPDCNGFTAILDGKSLDDGYCSCLIQPVYPTPMYETIMCLIIFFILWKLRKKITIPGLLFCVYMVFNGMERFAIESIRVTTKYGPFTQAQWIALGLILAGIGVGAYLYKTKKSTNAL